MAKRLLVVPMVIILLLASSIFVQAQDNVLDYGDVATGELTNSEFEIEYTFTGKAGEIVVIEMIPEDILGDLDSPVILLLGPNGRIYADTIDAFSFGDATLVFELNENGDYTIIATRADGRAGDSVGEFFLHLTLPQIIEAGEPISASTGNEERPQYFAVTALDNFSVLYERGFGDFYPNIEVNIINDGQLRSVGSATGDELTVALLGEFSGRGGPYIVSIGVGLFDFNFTTVTADFEISLVTAE